MRSRLLRPPVRRPNRPLRAPRGLRIGLLAGLLALGGCAVEFQNRQAVLDEQRHTAPSGSAYAGWRVFQGHCARCHGTDATGTGLAPDLVLLVRTMGPRQFATSVLQRYDWRLPPLPPDNDQPGREAWVDQIVRRQAGALTMPAWQDEPVVNAHVMDLYTYLSARAEGSLGPGRPRR